MKSLVLLAASFAFALSEILQNGQPRANPYPGQATLVSVATNSAWKSYPPNAPELSYKGRWDSKYISWWSAPGLKFGFTGEDVAVSFGNYTDPGVLVAYRFAGQDWQFSNVTANATYQFISPTTTGVNLTTPENGVTAFEMRVTNWAYGVQIEKVWTSSNGSLVQIPNHPLAIEIIGDSLSAGQYATYEAYPGICLHDSKCYGNLRGQTYQWLHTSDTSGRAIEIWGDNPEPWPFHKHQAADLVFINLGTNDANPTNNITSSQFTASYLQLIREVHTTWPSAQIILLSLWEGFNTVGNTYAQSGAFVSEIQSVYHYFNSGNYSGPAGGFVHYFNTTGILQHNDIGPQYHPTDVGHVKLASQLLQYVKLRFGWAFGATGPEVQSGTLYWNDQQDY